MMKVFKKLFVSTYSSELEQFILSRHPKNTGDIERLTIEYSRKSKQWN